MSVNKLRIRAMNDKSPSSDGDYVLCWMIANRRCHSNFSLDRAIEWCEKLQKPLLIFEALRCDYEWASVRLHRFVLQGMAVNQKAANDAGVSYFPFVERSKGDGSGLLKSLARKACVIVTDDFPSFFLPRMVEVVAKRMPVLLETVDSNGLLPMRAANEIFKTAYAFRRFLQQSLKSHLYQLPTKEPLLSDRFPKSDCLPKITLKRWHPADHKLLSASAAALSELPIDQSVGPAAFEGGAIAAQSQLDGFLRRRLDRYADDRNQPDDDASSGLSPYLHFGHISAHDVFSQVASHDGWTADKLGEYRDVKGARSGWWGMSEPAESFMDELITWRELGYNMCWQTDNYDKLESLPDWALKTIQEHAGDPRPETYSADELCHAQTADEIWNAAQTELVTDGRMHNYLRMLWGKKIYEWSETAQQALDVMIDLNNRFAVDGRNPNSYSGIFWVLGRYDRAWGPERPIFGKLRYMTSESTRRKLRLSEYLSRHATGSRPERSF